MASTASSDISESGVALTRQRTADFAPQFDVAVVGGGPVGLTCANLLASRGHSVVLFERNATTSNEAKAISLDDESLRILQDSGVAAQVLDIVVPGTGTTYFGRSGRRLFHATTPEPYSLGYPFKNPFSQPELEAVLLAALAVRPTAEVHFATTVDQLMQGPDGVEITARDVRGQRTSYRAAWVLACDGGRSTVRKLLNIGMTGRNFDTPWLVLDTVGDAHDEQHGLHFGDPQRPHVIVPGRDGRCRYEFLLYDGEAEPGDVPSLEFMRRLLATYRDVDADDIERAVIYTFNALVAKRWQDNRCFLLGDAAHMMPPFAGQGLNSGLRDAGNLCWKVSDVLNERLTSSALASYESERRPHVEATVDLSVRLGSVVMTTSRLKAAIRDGAVRLALCIPPARRYLTEMRYRPRSRVVAGIVMDASRIKHRSLRRRLGTTIPQPRVYDTSRRAVRLLDDVLGPGWSFLGVDLTQAQWDELAGHELAQRLNTRTLDVSVSGHLRRGGNRGAVLADVDGGLGKLVAHLAGHWLLVRPDRVIAAIGSPGEFGALAELCDRFMATKPRHAAATAVAEHG